MRRTVVPTTDRKKVECFHCGRIGHFKRDKYRNPVFCNLEPVQRESDAKSVYAAPLQSLSNRQIVRQTMPSFAQLAQPFVTLTVHMTLVRHFVELQKNHQELRDQVQTMKKEIEELKERKEAKRVTRSQSEQDPPAPPSDSSAPPPPPPQPPTIPPPSQSSSSAPSVLPTSTNFATPKRSNSSIVSQRSASKRKRADGDEITLDDEQKK